MKVTKDNYLSFLPSLKLACSQLKGSERRMFLGQLANDLGYGGYRLIEKTMKIGRKTIAKGVHEIETGIPIKDKFQERGRKPLEETNPELIEAIRKIVDSECQTDPKFTSQRLYTRLSVEAVRKQLLQSGIKESKIPCNQTIRDKMISLGYKSRKVAKTKPLKKNQAN